MRKEWTPAEIGLLCTMYQQGGAEADIAAALRRSLWSVKSQIANLRGTSGLRRQVVSQPVTQRLTNLLTVEGDALILTDVEAPYQHADFINRCIDLALRWGISQCILGGDYAHLANFSQWGADVTPAKPTEIDDPEIIRIINKLPKLEQASAKATLLERMRPVAADETVTSELASVRNLSRELSSAFSKIVYMMGNHDYRPLRFLGKSEPVDGLLGFIGAGEGWLLTEKYHCLLKTENPVPYRITHPRGAGAKMAIELAVQFHQHIIMGHSHRWAVQRDPSGDFWAIQAGHCVDETRLSYVMNRDARRDAHALGAVLVRGGFPLVLCDSFPFSVI